MPFKSVRLVAGQRVRLPSGLSPSVSLLVGRCVRLVSLLSPFVSLLVSGLVSLLVGHCVRLVSLLSPFVSLITLSPFFPKQFTVRGSQCFKEWSPWCWMAWSGSRPACLPLPFICLPVLFICLPGVLVVRFPAGLSPTFICFPLLFMCLPLPFICPPLLFICLPLPFICPPLLFICLPVLFICLPGWVLVVGFPALVSHFFSFVSQAGCLWSGSRLACLPLPFICLPGSVLVVWFRADFLAFVSHFLLFVSDFFSFVPAGLSPTSLICLPFPFNYLYPTFSPNSLLLGVLNSFLRCCPPFVSLLVSAHLHWPLVV